MGALSAVIGTHTHVPTADEQILNGGTAYISDAGMCGDFDSVLGMDKEEPINRFLTKIASRRFAPSLGEATICGVGIEVDDATGLARAIAPVQARRQAVADGAGLLAGGGLGRAQAGVRAVGLRGAAMGQETLQAVNRLVEMEERPIGVVALVVERQAGMRHMIGGLGAELRQAGCSLGMRPARSGFPFRRHECPLPLIRRRPVFRAPSL